MNGYERAHAKAITASQKRMQAILDKYEAEIARLAATVSTDPGEPFRFADHPTLEARYDRLIKDMEAEIKTAVTEGAKTEWGRADGKNDALAVSVTGSAEKAMAEGYIRRNKDALEAFLERKSGGMTLSDRVWMYTGQYSTQIQDAIGIAVQDGTSAAELSREVRRYLQRPDTLFRRVRDEYGVLHLSKNAKAYHPGAGVYRSAYMNARRLAVTEMNMAYRTSDYMRVQQLDFVVGIEVHLSGNHNCKGIPPGQFYDICDELKGKYPKTFKFTGWHPHCRCYTTTILKSREEMEEDAKHIKEGKSPSKAENSPQAVTKLPDNFTKWLSDNQQRVATANRLPYFLKDNGARNADGVWEPFTKVLPQNQQSFPLYFPKGLSESYKKDWEKNSLAISEKIGVNQGKEMSFEEANELKGNPHYVQGSGSGYTVNCQSCVVANELRRRGWDVEAMMNTKQKDNIPYKLSFDTALAWINPRTGNKPVKILCNKVKYTGHGKSFKGQTLKQITENINDATKETGRYNISFAWKGGRSGHILTVERLENGELHFYDPQIGKKTSWEKDYAPFISRSREVWILRVDELMPNPDYIGCVAKAGSTKAPGAKYAKKSDGLIGELSVELKSKLPDDIKKRRNEIKVEAKKLTNKNFENDAFGHKIKISGRGIDEWLNQPFSKLNEKNETLLNLERTIKEAKYIGELTRKTGDSFSSYLFETTIGGEKSWIIVRKYDTATEYWVHSVSDSPDIVKHIKK